MLNYFITAVLAVVISLGTSVFSPIQKIWDNPPLTLGTANFPTSLDTTTTLPNPSGTDSVATVSHSGLHTNENGGIIATETKLGTGASTPTSGTLLYGNGTGSSIWSNSPSITGITLSGQGIFNSFIALASSTILGNLNITGNSTTTSATSTNLFSTNAQFTNLNGTNVNGYGLTSCNGGNFVQWSNGTFGCASPGSTSNVSTTTTTGTWYATTTVTGLSANKTFDVSIYIGTSTIPASDSSGLAIVFNNSRLDDIYSTVSINSVIGSWTNKYVYIPIQNTGYLPGYINITIDNLTGHNRVGNFQYTEFNSLNSTYVTVGSTFYGSFRWATTTPITSISVGPVKYPFKISSTTIDVFQR